MEPRTIDNAVRFVAKMYSRRNARQQTFGSSICDDMIFVLSDEPVARM